MFKCKKKFFHLGRKKSLFSTCSWLFLRGAFFSPHGGKSIVWTTVPPSAKPRVAPRFINSYFHLSKQTETETFSCLKREKCRIWNWRCKNKQRCKIVLSVTKAKKWLFHHSKQTETGTFSCLKRKKCRIWNWRCKNKQRCKKWTLSIASFNFNQTCTST